MFTDRRIVVLLLAVTTLAAEKKAERTDLYGEPLPKGAIARLGPGSCPCLVLAGTFAFSPDGKTMATVAADGTLRLEKPPAGLDLLRPFQGPRSVVNSLALSADGRNDYSAGRGIVEKNGNWLLETARRRKSPHFSDHKKKHLLLSVAVSPDRNWRAAAFPDGTLRIWAVAHPDLVRTIQKRLNPTQAVVFSPDGKQVATAAKDGTVRLWDAAEAKEIRRLRGLPEQAVAFAYSPDGKAMAAAGKAGAIHVWNPITGKELRRLQYNRDQCPVYGVAFAMEGRTVMAGGYEHIHQWNVDKGEMPSLADFAGSSSIFAFALSPKGNFVVMAAMDGSIHGMGMTRDVLAASIRSSSSKAVRSLAFSPDGNTVATAGVDGLRLWEAHSGREKRRLIWNQDREIDAVAFSPEGSLLTSGAEGGVVRVWELPSGREKHRFEGLQKEIAMIAFLDKGILAAGYSNGKACLWNVAQGRELRSFGKPDLFVRGFAIAPAKKILASANWHDGTVHLWNAATGREQRHFQSNKGGVRGVAFAPGGEILATAGWSDKTIRLWDVRTGRQRNSFPASERGDHAVAFSPDGKALAIMGPQAIQIVETATGRERVHFESHRDSVNDFAFSSDGKMLASAGTDGTVLIWDVTGRCPDGRWQTHDLTAAQLQSQWRALAGEDAAAAHKAIWALTAAPRQSVPFLQEHLRPVARKDTKRLPALLADLDSDQFTVREKATHELEEMGAAAEAALRKVLAGKPSLELRRRVEPMVKDLENWPASSSAALRDWRALEVLEHLGTPEARRLLQRLAEGDPEARQTREVKAALQRLAARQTPMGK